ncbi:MAG: hypothetical protein K0Q50_1002 [Vampirovibrio sp.]|nr:hypothetical protein [Vampirovibrio sp.]
MLDAFRPSAFNRSQAVSKPSSPPLPQQARQPLQRSSLSGLSSDTLQFGGPSEEAPTSDELLENTANRTELICFYQDSFANPETRERLRDYFQKNATDVSQQPKPYLNALQQLAEHEGHIKPDGVIARYEQYLQQSLAIENSEAERARVNMEKARQFHQMRSQRRRNSKPIWKGESANNDNPFQG